ncbi:MAG TPA: hypothetical protein VK814_14895 [Acidobacteriaceae bacterium]|nr:hypothetical protein [Acidobacteriaceae bacterium]
MSPLTTTLALLLAAALPQSTAPPTSPTTTFHSDALHLDYTYAAAFTTLPTVADQALQSEKDKASGAVAKATVSCISLPLTATDSRSGFRMISIMRLDGTCLGRATTSAELAALATSSLTDSLKRFGDPQIGTAAYFHLADHPAAVLSGSVTSEKYGATFYGTATCLIQGNDAVCWEFLASKCSALPELLAYPIAFDGQPAQPLIPAKFAQACKP